MMKILWISNMIFPALCEELGLSRPVTGGWLYNLADQLSKSSDINLAVVSIYNGQVIKRCQFDDIQYYLLPAKSMFYYQRALESHWQKVCQEYNPDVVHIHGTEYPAGLACMRACPNLDYVVSIQGLVSVIAAYYYAGMSTLDILRNVTFRDIVKMDTIFQAKHKFIKRGMIEKEYIRRANTISGQTDWDFSHVKYINPKVRYRQNNRILREEFYTSPKWKSSGKKSHSIFLSQAGYPVKGLHQVLKAAALLKRDFPDIMLRVAGCDISKNDTIKDKIRLTGYGKYLLNLIKEFHLEGHIQFIGCLDQDSMIREYLNCNVFVSPSSIENESNSVAEAQILGTPCIASYVGGVPDMICNGKTGLLYRFEEVLMLAEQIRRVFTDNEMAQRLSLAGIETASERHDIKKNLDFTVQIYKDTISGNGNQYLSLSPKTGH